METLQMSVKAAQLAKLMAHRERTRTRPQDRLAHYRERQVNTDLKKYIF